jgi:hypothetical protein
LPGVLGNLVGQTRVTHQRAAAQRDTAGRRHQPPANIAEGVAVVADGNVGLGDDGLASDEIFAARRMDREHDHHRCRRWRGIGDFETDFDLHRQRPLSEVRATPQHPPFTNFGKSWALANLIDPRAASLFEVPGRVRRLRCRNFK